MKKSLNISALAACFMLVLSSCGGSGDKSQSANQTANDQSTLPVENEMSNSISLEASDQMQYNKAELRVAAGQTITLVFKHTGTLAKEAMGHNFVLLKQGTDIEAFSQKALGAKDHDYIPESESANIIAHTRLIGGGESDTIEFTVSEKGTYDYICSFPGHSSFMKGKLIVM